VARGILGGLDKLVPKRVVRRIVEVNGQPGVAGYLDGKPFSVITLEGEGDDGTTGRTTIRAIYMVTNPEKLSRLPGVVDDVN
jgi:hypothetical protein